MKLKDLTAKSTLKIWTQERRRLMVSMKSRRKEPDRRTNCAMQLKPTGAVIGAGLRKISKK